MYKLLDIPRPKEPFVMFEISHVDKNKDKGYYILPIKDRRSFKIVYNTIIKTKREEHKTVILSYTISLSQGTMLQYT
jgi:hypothetical protein